MDEVLEKLQTTIISPESKNEASNFEGLYKNWGRLGNQEERRKEILQVQKGNRNNKLDKYRGILDLVTAVQEDQVFRSYKSYRPSIYVAGFNKTSPTYCNVLMLSEWMIEKPHDFNEEWFVVPCPKGVRMLVVANMGSTKCYLKYGQFKFECRTALPGGNPCDPKNMRNQCCVLDCFYQEKNNTMYVLDLLAWNSLPMTDGETEFRNFWLKSQFSELPEVKYVNKRNEFIFTILPYISCKKESFDNFMSTYPAFECNFPPLDGLLFYHKRAHYFAGETPLVGWLFPYMVPEVLGADIKIHDSYMSEKPAGYVNQAEFIEKFEEKCQKKRPRNKRITSMDTDDSNNSDKNVFKSNTERKSEDAQNPIEETMEAEEPTKAEETMEAEEITEATETIEAGKVIEVKETVAAEKIMETKEISESEKTTKAEKTMEAKKIMEVNEMLETKETIKKLEENSAVQDIDPKPDDKSSEQINKE